MPGLCLQLRSVIPLLLEHHQFVEGTVPDVIAKLQRYVHENGIKILKEPRDKRKTKDQIQPNLEKMQVLHMNMNQ